MSLSADVTSLGARKDPKIALDFNKAFLRYECSFSTTYLLFLYHALTGEAIIIVVKI